MRVILLLWLLTQWLGVVCCQSFADVADFLWTVLWIIHFLSEVLAEIVRETLLCPYTRYNICNDPALKVVRMSMMT